MNSSWGHSRLFSAINRRTPAPAWLFILLTAAGVAGIGLTTAGYYLNFHSGTFIVKTYFIRAFQPSANSNTFFSFSMRSRCCGNLSLENPSTYFRNFFPIASVALYLPFR